MASPASGGSNASTTTCYPAPAGAVVRYAAPARISRSAVLRTGGGHASIERGPQHVRLRRPRVPRRPARVLTGVDVTLPMAPDLVSALPETVLNASRELPA